MRILVTGGAGFIGSHLVNKLVELNHEAVVLDNLSAGRKENVNSKAKFIEGDIRDSFEVGNAMKGCEAVFHLAAMADARDGGEKMYEVNYLGSQNVFTAAQESNAKIIFTSSAAVYGNASLCKEDSECKPVNEYGKSKLKAEKALMKALPNAFIARMFNVYGPNGNSVINRFCKNIPNYEDITIFGTGMQTRDYVFVSDVVDALMLGLENNGIYNAGTGVETGLLELIDVIENISGAKANMKFEKPIEGEIMRSRADISKISQLGWKPKVSLKEGVRMILGGHE